MPLLPVSMNLNGLTWRPETRSEIVSQGKNEDNLTPLASLVASPTFICENVKCFL